MDKEKIWNEFLNQINSKVSTASFNTWFKPLKFIDIVDEKILLLNPGKIYVDQINNYYKDLVEDTLLEITGNSYTIEFKDKYDENEYDIRINSPDEFINNIDNLDKVVQKQNTNLKEEYTFDNFVVGESNRFAFSSALAVAQNPGKLYNPLFLYGKSGLGKTHLMHAIGNYITNNSNLRVLYISTDDFMNDFIRMTQKTGNKDDNLSYIDLFKSKYRDIDVLMIDDIQFLGNATVTQQEFTNTFNSLYYNDKQIIISSDKSVNDLKLFEDRLKTRFNWGLKAIINVPEYDLKVKIIKNKIKSENIMINISDDIVNFIASNCGSDVRNLEGSIRRLHAYCTIMNIKDLELETALDALDEYANGRGTYTDNSIGKIMSVVANYFNITVEDITGKRRNKDIATARMITMYLCRILTDETYPRIGLELGGRDHSTVIHGYEKINEDLKKNPELQKMISELKVKMSE